MNDKIEKEVEGNDRVVIGVLFRYLHDGLE
jgi:hypothetical protein